MAQGSAWGELRRVAVSFEASESRFGSSAASLVVRCDVMQISVEQNRALFVSGSGVMLESSNYVLRAG